MGKLSIPEIRYWLDECKSAEERQKKELIRNNNYPLLIKYYEGYYKLSAINDSVLAVEQMAIINEYFPNTNALISQILFSDPDIIAIARKPQAIQGENLMKSALTYGWDKSEGLIENRIALFDMIYAGYAAVEVGHIIDYDRGTIVQGLPSEETPSKGLGERVLETVKSVFSSEKAEEKLDEEAPSKEATYATNEMTYIRRWNPLNILFDWKAERFKDSRYLIKKVYLSQGEFNVKYPEYKDKVRGGTNFEFAQHEDEKHKKSILLYEIQIKKKNNEYWNLCIAPSYPMEEIDYYKRPYVTNGFDVKIGTFNKYGKLYPVSIAQENKKLQDDINNYVTHMMEVAERNIPKIGYNKNRVKADGISGLENTNVNALVPVDGGVENVFPIQATHVSAENKELLAIFQNHNDKLWSVSESRLQGQSQAKFATELQIQESGFQAQQLDIQEGLRFLINDELDTYKDIIVTFWDGEYFFKVTGGQKPEWYEPQVDPMTGMVLNPLTDLLTGDYDIKVNIESSAKMNKLRKKKELVEFATWITNPNVMMILMKAGYDVSLFVDIIKKVSKEFNIPDELFEQSKQQVQNLPPEIQGLMGGGQNGTGLPLQGMPMEGPEGIQPNGMPALQG